MSAKGGNFMKSGKHVSEERTASPLRRPLIVGIALSVLFLLFFICWYSSATEDIPAAIEEPLPTSVITAPSPSPVPSPEPTPEPLPAGTPPEIERQSGIYTFLLAGLDEASNSTDTIMVIRFDTKQHRLDAVSIP